MTALVIALRAMSGSRVSLQPPARLWVTGYWPAAQRSTPVLGSHAGGRSDRDSATPREQDKRDWPQIRPNTATRAACLLGRSHTDTQHTQSWTRAPRRPSPFYARHLL